MKIACGDIEIGYDRVGSGDPILLVMGLATSRLGWAMQMPVLGASYDVVCFDNRGVGDTSTPAEPWTMRDMADDAVRLMDALEWKRAHVVGISMGGMISQEIAITYPERVRSLTLIATHHGGPDAIHPAPEVVADLTPQPGAQPAEMAERMVRRTFGRRYQEEFPQIIDMIIQFAAANPPSLQGVMNQVTAIVGWMAAGGSAARLSEVEVPALVLHGTADELIPFPNGEKLAAAIPGAGFRSWVDAGHALIQERADEVNEELLAHLADASDA